MSLALDRIRSPVGEEMRRISLLGQLADTAEIAELRALLAASETSAVELLCFDADHLPAALIEAIAAALDRGIDIKVRAYRPLLAFSLLRLSLPVLPVPPQLPVALLENCRAVALAGSANSLDKMLTIVEQLPDSTASIFVAQHVLADRENLLDQLLQARTGYRVIMPQHMVKVEPRTIYVAPPGHHMKVAHGLVYLTRDRMISFARPSIDVLFESLAGEYGATALVALLCGFGSDGVAGCAAVRAAGGCVLVEDAGDCDGAGVLPNAALTAGHYDHRLKQHGIASLVAAAVSPRDRSVGPGPLLDIFLEAVHEQTGYDFRGYQRGTLARRIDNLIRQTGYASFFDLQRAALCNPQMTQRLLTELSVNVTELFRHPEQFRELRDTVLPYLASFPLIKVWSAGCATGEEAYSLAILLDELGLLEKSRIFATDINAYLLELAQSGLLPKEGLEKSRANYVTSGGGELSRHIEDHGRYLKVAERLRSRVLFHHHALGQDGGFNEFQLIVCRNVMIYFDPEMQRRVFSLFAQSLHREGFLLLGPSDGLATLARDSGFRMEGSGKHFYRFAGSTP